MYLLHRAYNEGRRGALYGLVPLFLLWANVDDSFFLGLLILAAAVIGRVLDGQVAESLIQPVEPAGRRRRDGRRQGRPGPPDPDRPGRGPRRARRLRRRLPGQPLDLPDLPLRPHPGLPALRAGNRLRHGRSAFLFRQGHPPAGSVGLVLVDGVLSLDGRRGPGVVPVERPPVRLEPLPAVRGHRGLLGRLHPVRTRVRHRLRRGPRPQRPGVVSRSVRRPRAAGRGLDHLVDRGPAGDARRPLLLRARSASPAGGRPRTTRGSASATTPTSSPSRPPSTCPGARTSRGTC